MRGNCTCSLEVVLGVLGFVEKATLETLLGIVMLLMYVIPMPSCKLLKSVFRDLQSATSSHEREEDDGAVLSTWKTRFRDHSSSVLRATTTTVENEIDNFDTEELPTHGEFLLSICRNLPSRPPC